MQTISITLLASFLWTSPALPQQISVAIQAPVPETTEPSPIIRVRPGEFRITREGGDSLGELRVHLEYSGTAIPGLDYAELPASVVIPAGALGVTLLVAGHDDNEVEEDETVIATLVLPQNVPPSGYVIAADRRQARVVIHDSDISEPPLTNVLRIEATQPIAEETSAPLRRLRFDGLFTISRTGPTNDPLPVSLSYYGTATYGQDYPALPISITIPAGAVSVEIPVLATEDHLPEAIETVSVTLRAARNVPGQQQDSDHGRATVFIRDDGVTQASVDLIQPKDGAHFELGQPIHLAAVAIDLESYISRVEFYAGEELIGVSELHFFRAPDPGTPIHHTFEWQEAPAGEHVLTARALRDEGTKLISQPVHIVVGQQPSERVVFEIATTDPLAREPGANNLGDRAVFTVRRSAGPLNTTVSVFYLVEGTATNGEDYEHLNGSVLFRAGERSVDIVVRPRADELAEGEETVVVRVVPTPCLPSAPPSDCYQVGPQDTARAVIIDRSEVRQAPRGFITHPTPHQEFEPGDNVEIRLQAMDPDGYVRLAEFFADGHKIGEQSMEFIQPPDPGQVQIFEFVWENPMPGWHRLGARVTDNEGLMGAAPPVEILVSRDQTLPIVAVVVLDSFAREPSENSQSESAAFGVVRFGSSADAMEVSYSMGGTAENGVDYERLSGVAVIPAGHESVVISVLPFADNQLEGIETVGLRLTESSHYQLAHSRQVHVVIADANFHRPGANCIALAEGSRYLCFAGESGRRYRIEASPDLRIWQALFEGWAVNDALHFVDDGTEGHACRFYRLVPVDVDYPSVGISREQAIIALEMHRTINDSSPLPLPPLPPTPITPAPTATATDPQE